MPQWPQPQRPSPLAQALPYLEAGWRYTRRNWKIIASLGLTALVALNGVFDLIPAGTISVIVGVAAALGIGLHHKGDDIVVSRQ